MEKVFKNSKLVLPIAIRQIIIFILFKEKWVKVQFFTFYPSSSNSKTQGLEVVKLCKEN